MKVPQKEILDFSDLPQEDNYKLKRESKRCPYCGEEILKLAKKCKHCGEDLEAYSEGSEIPASYSSEISQSGSRINKDLPKPIYFAFAGIIIVFGFLLLYIFVLRDTWEIDNLETINNLQSQAKSYSQNKKYYKAIETYEQIFELLGDRELKLDFFKKKIEDIKYFYEIARKNYEVEYERDLSANLSILKSEEIERGSQIDISPNRETALNGAIASCEAIVEYIEKEKRENGKLARQILQKPKFQEFISYVQSKRSLYEEELNKLYEQYARQKERRLQEKIRKEKTDRLKKLLDKPTTINLNNVESWATCFIAWCESGMPPSDFFEKTANIRNLFACTLVRDQTSTIRLGYGGITDVVFLNRAYLDMQDVVIYKGGKIDEVNITANILVINQIYSNDPYLNKGVELSVIFHIPIDSSESQRLKNLIERADSITVRWYALEPIPIPSGAPPGISGGVFHAIVYWYCIGDQSHYTIEVGSSQLLNNI